MASLFGVVDFSNTLKLKSYDLNAYESLIHKEKFLILAFIYSVSTALKLKNIKDAVYSLPDSIINKLPLLRILLIHNSKEELSKVIKFYEGLEKDIESEIEKFKLLQKTSPENKEKIEATLKFLENLSEFYKDIRKKNENQTDNT